VTERVQTEFNDCTTWQILGHVPLDDARCIARSRGINEAPRTRGLAEVPRCENACRHIVQACLGDRLVLDVCNYAVRFAPNYDPGEPNWLSPGHSHVQPGHRANRRMLRRPVGHNEPLEFELLHGRDLFACPSTERGPFGRQSSVENKREKRVLSAATAPQKATQVSLGTRTSPALQLVAAWLAVTPP